MSLVGTLAKRMVDSLVVRFVVMGTTKPIRCAGWSTSASITKLIKRAYCSDKVNIIAPTRNNDQSIIANTTNPIKRGYWPNIANTTTIIKITIETTRKNGGPPTLFMRFRVDAEPEYAMR